MLFIALFIGRLCGSMAESRGKDRRTWFRRGAIISFLVIWGIHQIFEFKRFKKMGIPLKDFISKRLA